MYAGLDALYSRLQISGKETKIMTMTPGTQDGTGAGNHDAPYEFGRVHPTTERPLPFTVVQFARLLVLRLTAQERGEGPRRP